MVTLNKILTGWKKIMQEEINHTHFSQHFSSAIKAFCWSLSFCSYSSFCFLFTRPMLVRDAQTRSLLMFLFVTMNDCMGLCVSIWRAWFSKLNKKSWVEHQDNGVSIFCLFTHSNAVFIYICDILYYIVDRCSVAFSLISIFSFVYFEVIAHANFKKVFEIDLIFQTRR